MNNDKIAFVGGVENVKNSFYFKKYYNRNYFSSDPLQMDLIKGLFENTNQKIVFLNIPFFPKSKISFRVQKQVFDTEYSSVINVAFNRANYFEHISKKNNLYRELLSLPEDISTIIVYSTYFAFLNAIAKFKRKKRASVRIILIVPDLVKYSGVQTKKSLYNSLSNYFRNHFFEKHIKEVDGFVFLTRQMNNAINKFSKPFEVVEGIAPSNYYFTNIALKKRKRIIMYSGSLQYRYGLRTMIDAIKTMNDENVEFHFYGNGEAVDELIKLSTEFDSIKYCGTVDRKELHLYQQNAYALINPRSDSEDFTKYSFPSKLLEYLLSGKPVICYKLPGIPKEYDPFLNYISGNGECDLASFLKFFLQLNYDELLAKAKRGREFVLKEKNPKAQTRKVLKLIDEMR